VYASRCWLSPGGEILGGGKGSGYICPAMRDEEIEAERVAIKKSVKTRAQVPKEGATSEAPL